MNLNQFFIIGLNLFLYLFVFLFIFFVIYRVYIYRFDLKPHPCMSDKCIRQRMNQSIQS
jgi:uncharacterized protein YneF (UPF0154 family)